MECPFCEINVDKTRILANNKFTLVIFSNPRLMPGHLLVIPKRHVEKISELSKEEQEELFSTLIKFQEKVLNKLSKGCDLRQNFRPFQKQSNLKINHLHFHIQPRELFDELYEKCQIFETNVFKELSEEELTNISKQLED
jgi:diadenosine tetraphosphate (Ap4A) HIT family hydrolase